MRTILCSALLLFTSPAFADCSEYAYNQVLPISQVKVKLLCKNGFAIGYSTDRKTPMWVVQRIDPNTNYVIQKRPSFHKDPSIAAEKQPSNSDYVGTGFDKGHLVAFEDLSFSQDSAYDSMGLTNIVPQNFSNNRGGWKSLEMLARKMGKDKQIYVISGPIFEGKVDYLGRKVPIPTHLFKIIVDPVKMTSRTYILPNTPVAAHEVNEYVFKLKDVRASGVDPLPNSNLRETK